MQNHKCHWVKFHCGSADGPSSVLVRHSRHVHKAVMGISESRVVLRSVLSSLVRLDDQVIKSQASLLRCGAWRMYAGDNQQKNTLRYVARSSPTTHAGRLLAQKLDPSFLAFSCERTIRSPCACLPHFFRDPELRRLGPLLQGCLRACGRRGNPF